MPPITMAILGLLLFFIARNNQRSRNQSSSAASKAPASGQSSIAQFYDQLLPEENMEEEEIEPIGQLGIPIVLQNGVPQKQLTPIHEPAPAALTHTKLKARLTSPRELKTAFLLKEILDPPKGLSH